MLSVATVAVLWDAVRVRSGGGAAFWAGVLMAVAVPQVQYGRLTRSYALLTLAAAAAADAVARIERDGATRRRVIAVGGATAAMLLTHYFAAPVVAAVGAYAILVLRGPARRAVVVGVGQGVVTFSIAWGPFLPRQLHLFAADDPATDFLRREVGGHVGQTLWRAALVPLTMLFPQPPGQARFAVVGAVLYAAPVAAVLWKPRRRLPAKPVSEVLRRAGSPGQPGFSEYLGDRLEFNGLAFWGLWLWAAVGLVTALDLWRGTTHLFYVRYFILAGPAVCALVPTVMTAATPTGWPRRAGHAVSAAAAAGCLLAWSDAVVDRDRADVAEVTAAVRPTLSADDVVVFVTEPRLAQFAGGQYLLFDRYLGPLGPLPCGRCPW